MSASLPTVDRRPIPSVAIIGNDAVLAAAPATSVQLAHACLRRGFTVAVPASWGDELVAAEAVRRLATRDRGPAVMCVCPFVRSRLLAPGPDLAPFLVSLVSPPIATARYLRAVYGEGSVHVTYIGGCPSAEDSTIDARLTPDAFLADIAEHGIALSEQPLVFDSIVPPDRRRWCSLPGGAPSAEILWNDTDTRTLVEIDRHDISTDLAQHIITREHVLLDLAPSLGCVCSGAVNSLPPRSARVAVIALEPPRALRPVIELPASVPLDVPVGAPPANSPVVEPPSAVPAADIELVVVLDSEPVVALDSEPVVALDVELMESRLDEMLGTEVGQPTTNIEIEADFATAGPWASSEPANVSDVVAGSDVLVASEVEVAAEVSVASVPAPVDPEPVLNQRPEVVADEELAPPMASPPTVTSPVRRRTPVPMLARHPASSIPRATSSDGRALPRAYVAKRRTPSGGTVPVEAASPPVETVVPRVDATPAPPVPLPDVAAEPSTLKPATTSDAAKFSASSTRPESPSSPPIDSTAPPGPNRSGAAVTAPNSSPTAVIVLFVALLALGFFVLRSLN